IMHEHATLIQKSICPDSIVPNSNSTVPFRRLFQHYRPTTRQVYNDVVGSDPHYAARWTMQSACPPKKRNWIIFFDQPWKNIVATLSRAERSTGQILMRRTPFGRQ